MTKFSSESAPTFSARLYPSEIKTLKGISDGLGLHGVADLLHQLASAEAVILIIEQDTSGAMTATAKRIRKLLKSLDTNDYDALGPILSGIAAALDSAAKVRAELKQAESAEIADDYKDS
jgi:hypothetical protein